MSLTNPDKPITKQDLKDFYDSILPYLGGRAYSAFTPVGTIISVMSNSCPTNYLTCNGQVVNIADYPELATHFETQFGSKNYFGGDGTTTFAVPDLRGEFLRGAGTNSHSGEGSGTNVGSHQAATIIPRIHTANGTGGPVTYGKGLSVANVDAYASDSDKTYYYMKTESISSAESGSSTIKTYTTRPTNTSVQYCIAVKNIFMDGGINYSEDEQIVGSWIDGKPLYQKTFIKELSGITNGTPKNFDVATISDLALARNVWGYCFGVFLPSAWTVSGTVYFLRAQMNGTTLQVQGNRDTFNNKNCYITLQYTKTTD